MSLTDQDFEKLTDVITKIVKFETKDIPFIKNQIEILRDDINLIKDSTGRIERKHDEDYAFLEIQVIDINKHLVINK